MSVLKVVVHTDVLLDFLLHKRPGRSVLRLAMSKFFCYTAAFNAIQLFSMARNSREMRAVESSMAALKILGLNPKNARKHGILAAQHPAFHPLDLLVTGICLESRLPLLTGRHELFRSVENLLVIPAVLVTEGASGMEILRAARRFRSNRSAL